MLFVVWLPLVLQLLIPVGLLAWLALGRPSSIGAWVIRAVLAGCYFVAIGVGGLWLILPWYTPLIYGVLLLVAMACSFRSIRTLPLSPAGRRGPAGMILVASAAVGFAGLSLYMTSGWRTPQDAVELLFPLRRGTYLVVNGGGNELINAHLKTLTGERFRPWRGESFGVDVEKLDAFGLRVRGILPSDPAAYAIFGEPVYAPCAGHVIAAIDGVAEMPPPRMDREHMAGNYVILECDGVWVLLGHLQRGSVRVQGSERIEPGQWLARVGNTGNTGEPHLHIHAQRPGTESAPLSGDPLPIRFGPKFPVRNTRITVLETPAGGAR
jgi:hypothetical protein